VQARPDELEAAEHVGERRAQVVRGAGEEIVAQADRRLGRSTRRPLPVQQPRALGLGGGVPRALGRRAADPRGQFSAVDDDADPVRHRLQEAPVIRGEGIGPRGVNAQDTTALVTHGEGHEQHRADAQAVGKTRELGGVAVGVAGHIDPTCPEGFDGPVAALEREHVQADRAFALPQRRVAHPEGHERVARGIVQKGVDLLDAEGGGNVVDDLRERVGG